MDFELNEEQKAFQKVLRSFVDKEIMPVAIEWEHSGRYPTEIVDHMKAMGLFGITIPEEYGGLNLDMVSFCLVYEGHSRHPGQPWSLSLDDRPSRYGRPEEFHPP